MKSTFTFAAIGFALVAFTTAPLAHENHDQHGGKATIQAQAAAPEQKPWGIAGQASAVRRTIDIAMTDDMRFTPALLEVRAGETVRFRLKNTGQLLHELVLGTATEIAAHAAMMKSHPGMQHEAPWMVHVPAGKTGDMVWHFNRAGDFDFACLVQGHFELGMTGRIRVLPAARTTS